MYPIASSAPNALDIVVAYNVLVNFSSGIKYNGMQLPYLPCPQQTTLPSCSLQSFTLHATHFPMSWDFVIGTLYRKMD